MKKYLFLLPLLAALVSAPLMSGHATSSLAKSQVVTLRGVFAQGVECDGIRACDNSAFYTTAIPAGYAIGDEVFVVGRLNYDIISFCMQGPIMGILHVRHKPCQ